MRQALLIEDSPEFQMVVQATLAQEFDVTCCCDADQALAAIAARNFDLILIDVGLPGRNGLSLCEDFRRESRLQDVPILFVTGHNDPFDLVQGFAVGADDYVLKPFHPDELRARVRARMSRPARQPMHVDSFTIAGLHFSIGRQSVAVTESNGLRDLGLTPIEFKILYHLAKSEPKVVSRSNLLRAVWGQDLHIVERTVDKHICSLRRKLGPASRHVASVPGQGYAFVGQI